MTELTRGLLRHLAGDIGTEAGMRARGVLLDAIGASSASAPSVRFPSHPVTRAIAGCGRQQSCPPRVPGGGSGGPRSIPADDPSDLPGRDG